MIPTADKVAEYKRQIKAGEITEEQAYNEVLMNYPEIAGKITREQFKAEFEKIKNSP